MDENFLKFKKRVWLHILIKCISAGVAVGFLTVLAVLLPCRLYGIDLLWLLYILIFLGGAAVGGGIAFLFLRTDDKKIAKRLDSELNLNERVQTALTYGGQSGAMFDMQKADTSAVLGVIPLKSLAFKNIILSVLCCCISVSCIVVVPVVATTVPPVLAAQEEQPPVDPPRPITDWEWSALDELINHVKESKKADSFTKSGMISHLEGLKTVLLNGVSQSTLPAFVQNTINEIRNTVKDAADKGISDEQNELNKEEEAYVIAKLCEIFSINQPVDPDDPENPGTDPENPGTQTPGKPGVGPGTTNVNQMPFFDPDKANSKDKDGNYQSGETICGESRAEYYQRVQQALKEGTISQQEWEYIMVTYFGDLSGNEDK